MIKEIINQLVAEAKDRRPDLAKLFVNADKGMVFASNGFMLFAQRMPEDFSTALPINADEDQLQLLSQPQMQTGEHMVRVALDAHMFAALAGAMDASPGAPVLLELSKHGAGWILSLSDDDHQAILMSQNDAVAKFRAWWRPFIAAEEKGAK